MFKLLDHWTESKPNREIEYWMFVNVETHKVSCASRCKHDNRRITYAMSDEKTPTLFYGTQTEIEEIIKQFERK